MIARSLDLGRVDFDFIGQPIDLDIQHFDDQRPAVRLVRGVVERVIAVQHDLRAGRCCGMIDALDEHCGGRVKRRLTRLADGRVARTVQGDRSDRDQESDP